MSRPEDPGILEPVLIVLSPRGRTAAGASTNGGGVLVRRSPPSVRDATTTARQPGSSALWHRCLRP
jgi:hypothetical protein